MVFPVAQHVCRCLRCCTTAAAAHYLTWPVASSHPSLLQWVFVGLVQSVMANIGSKNTQQVGGTGGLACLCLGAACPVSPALSCCPTAQECATQTPFCPPCAGPVQRAQDAEDAVQDAVLGERWGMAGCDWMRDVSGLHRVTAGDEGPPAARLAAGQWRHAPLLPLSHAQCTTLTYPPPVQPFCLSSARARGWRRACSTTSRCVGAAAACTGFWLH